MPVPPPPKTKRSPARATSVLDRQRRPDSAAGHHVCRNRKRRPSPHTGPKRLAAAARELRAPSPFSLVRAIRPTAHRLDPCTRSAACAGSCGLSRCGPRGAVRRRLSAGRGAVPACRERQLLAGLDGDGFGPGLRVGACPPGGVQPRLLRHRRLLGDKGIDQRRERRFRSGPRIEEFGR